MRRLPSMFFKNYLVTGMFQSSFSYHTGKNLLLILLLNDFVWLFLVLLPLHCLDPKRCLGLKYSTNSENSQLIQACNLDFLTKHQNLVIM